MIDEAKVERKESSEQEEKSNVEKSKARTKIKVHNK